MRLRHTILAAALVSTGIAIASPAGAEPMRFVYKGSGCDGIPRVKKFEQVTGVKVDGVSDFLSAEGWPQMVNSANWLLGCWQPLGYRLALGVPLTVKGGSLAATARGDFDASFAQIGRLLVQKGQARAFLRLGWEFNGNWYPWSGNQDPAAFIAAYRRVASVLRRTPGQHFVLIWNPTVGTGDKALGLLYPGDDVVDLIGADVYNQSWNPIARISAMRWQLLNEGGFGLGFIRHFAATHGKKLALPEWGTGTRPDGHGLGDDPEFIHKMAWWMRANPVVFQSYWDFTASDYDATISVGNKFPQTLAAFQQEFGRAARK